MLYTRTITFRLLLNYVIIDRDIKVFLLSVE